MPVTTEEIKRHRELFGLEHPAHTTTERYRQHLAAGAIFWVDHHGFYAARFPVKFWRLVLNRLMRSSHIWKR